MSQNSKHDLGQVQGLILGQQKCLLNCTPEVGMVEVAVEGGVPLWPREVPRPPQYPAMGRLTFHWKTFCDQFVTCEWCLAYCLWGCRDSRPVDCRDTVLFYHSMQHPTHFVRIRIRLNSLSVLHHPTYGWCFTTSHILTSGNAIFCRCAVITITIIQILVYGLAKPI